MGWGGEGVGEWENPTRVFGYCENHTRTGWVLFCGGRVCGARQPSRLTTNERQVLGSNGSAQVVHLILTRRVGEVFFYLTIHNQLDLNGSSTGLASSDGKG